MSWHLEQGDCREVLKQWAADGVLFDSCVTDPPYDLTSIVKRFGKANAAPAKAMKSGDKAFSRLSRGFMGQTWDGTGVAFDPETWRAVYDVLKPGAHLVAFGGTRTSHRMTCAIEDAGFEIRDSLSWIYGCLDDTTQAMTPSGAVPYYKLKIGDLVLGYDPVYTSYQWEKVEEVFVYDIEDTAYRISTDYGDQLVSRNHRCIVERGGVETFEFAEIAAQKHEVRVPLLEDVHGLLGYLHGSEPVSSRENLDVLQTVSRYSDSERPEKETFIGTQKKNIRKLHSVRSTVLAKHEMAAKSQTTYVFEPLQRSDSGQGVGCVRAPRSCELAAGVEGLSENTHDWPDQSRVEGRSDLSQQARQLCKCPLCSVPDGFPKYVSQGQLRDGAPSSSGENIRPFTDANGMRAPRRPQSAEQQSVQLNAVRDEPGSQTVRTWHGHKTVVGRITPEHYCGIVWCVRVKSGAFVAVRNGFTFPTGNSGFPKSHDVSKGIDKAAGRLAHRSHGFNVAGQGIGLNPDRTLRSDHPDYTPYAPATPEAAQWVGYGTSLKPAYEPIILARKPLEGTVAGNTLAWGVGGINIDGCRVGLAEGESPFSYPNGPGGNTFSVAKGVDGTRSDAAEGHPAGRWPANLIHDGSPEVLEAFAQFGESTSSNAERHNTKPAKSAAFGAEKPNVTYGHADSGTAARFFPCCPRSEDELRFFYSAKANKKDRAGSNHPTVKPISLMKWLTRLVTPTGGLILEPFAGSGSTIQAAVEQGFDCMAIEQSADYCVDIHNRMKAFANV